MSHLDRLEDLGKLLGRSRRKTAPIEGIHGMLTAAVCGPTVVKPTNWLPFVYPATRDLKQLLKGSSFQDVITALLEIYHDLLFSIRQGTFVPYLSGEGETLQDAKLWCEGFFYGMALHGGEWMEHESEHLATLTAPILYIADPGDLSKELGKKQRQRLDRQQKQLVEAIRYNVPQVYDFWNVTKKADFKKDLYPTQEPPAS